MLSSLLLTLVLAVPSLEVEVGTVDGKSVTGAAAELTSSGVKLATAEGEKTIAAKELLSVTPAQAPPAPTDKPAVWLELVDGSRLTAATIAITKGTATLTYAADKQIEIPSSAIARVRFSPPDNQTSSWPADIGQNAAGDLLAVRKAEAIDFLEGVLGNVTEETVEFQLDGETIPVKRAKIDGFIYYHKAGDKFTDVVCIVEDVHGWRLKAKTIAHGPDGQLEVTTLSGATLRRPWSAISRLDFSSGKVVYLSDLEVDSFDQKSRIDLGNAGKAFDDYFGLRRDRGRENLPIRVGGKTYSKSIGLTSRTTATYRLPSGATKFKAVAAIDDAVREAGNVLLTISADGKQLYSAPVIGTAEPVALDLDVAGARKLTILVDYGEDLDIGDYLTLADARIVK
jgi:hypothetical protein